MSRTALAAKRLGSALTLALCFAGGLGCTPAPQSAPIAPAAPGKLLQGEGLGKDGSVMITAPGTIVNRYALLGADALRGDTTLTLSTTQGMALQDLMPLTVDDLLLVIQTQGADFSNSDDVTYGAITDLRSTGRFEFIGVSGIDMASGKVQLYTSCGGLRYDYQAAGNVQVIRVPQYLNLNVTKAGSIIAPGWNGQVGGVVAIVTQHGAIIDGSIDVSGIGFRGAMRNPISMIRASGVGSFYHSMSNLDGAYRGEGIANPTEYTDSGIFGRGAILNGGGGGNRVASGGGGGGNGGDLNDWNGEGVMSLQVKGGMQAWPLDPAYDATQTEFAGGGRGGYSASSAILDPLMIAPGDPNWSDDSRRERGGLGGRPVPNNAASRLFFGGGGGGGDDFMGTSGGAGSGGGLVYLTADSVTGAGLLRADGQPGGDAQDNASGAGGGGAGGTLVVGANQLTGVSLQANGGDGGSQRGMTRNAAGPGGGGGGGYIATSQGTTISRVTDPGVGGTSASTTMANFPNNGATDGAPGIPSGAVSGLFGGSPFCSAADLSISLQATPAQATHQDPFVIEIAVNDLGPSSAGNLVVNFTAPDGAAIGKIMSQGWDCRPSGQSVQCTIDALSPGPPSTIDVTIMPSLLLSALPFTATLAAQATDPDLSNNTATLIVPNGDPQIPRSGGGGFSCSVRGEPLPGSGGGRGAAVTLAGVLLALALAQSRRRRPVTA